MVTFCVSLILLIAGYFIYGKIVERIFGIDKNKITPAYSKQDGVDYVPMSTWKIFLIQFLNIAGVGPIFGAIMGVLFGPASFIWIVFGTIFAGAMHDFMSGMISIRRGGASLPEIVGSELGNGVKQFMRAFTVLLMVLVGAVFVKSPADLLAGLTPEHLNLRFWIIVVFVYYLLATLLPIDKLIGKIYPVFGAAMLFMALGVMFALFYNNAPIPEITTGLQNRNPAANTPIFPMMFVSIACGAISGFHATQSPLMARCMKNEKHGRPVFYGAMVAEGVVALVWAAAASSFFGGYQGLQDFLASHGNNAGAVVTEISNSWLGRFGGLLAILGVIAAPITSGDTALRSARLIVADFLNFDQKPIWKRLAIALPIFLITFVLLQVNFDVLWRYFAWSNQTLSVFTLWAITIYLTKEKKCYFIAIIPALFMTFICTCFICFAKIGFNLPIFWSYMVAAAVCVIFVALFYRWKKKLPTL